MKPCDVCSVSGATWALVASPLQALAVNEACAQFNINSLLTRILIIADSKRGLDQIYECLPALSWRSVEELPGVSTPEKLRESRARVHRLAKCDRPEMLLLGDFRNLLGQHIARKLAKRTILVDDGTAMHRFARARRAMHSSSGERARRTPQWIRRLSHRVRYGLHTGALPPLTIFTIYSDLEFDPRDNVVCNDFRNLRSNRPLTLSEEVWIVGGCLVELGLVTSEFYEESLYSIVQRSHGRLRYFPHRKEDTEKLSRYATRYGFHVEASNVPLELYLISSGCAPQAIYGFYSTALDTLYRFTEGLSTKIYAIRIPTENIQSSAEDRSFIETVYQYFSRYSARFSVLDSHRSE